MKKTFLSLNEQIDLLKSRGLNFNSEEDLNKFKWYLDKYNYQNFVNGYNDLFMVNSDRKTNFYIKECNSNNLINLFNLDRKLVSLLIGPILNIERSFASAICYELMNNYENILGDGLILNLSDEELLNIFPKLRTIDKNNEINISRNINDLKESLFGYGRNKKMNEKYSSEKMIPLWSLACNWSFGNINKIFSCLGNQMQKIISSKFIKETLIYKNYTIDFSKIMVMLNNFRNMLCHGNVIYNFKYYIVKQHNLSINRFYENVFNIKIKYVKLAELILAIKQFDPHHKNTNKMIELYNQYIAEFIDSLEGDILKDRFKAILTIKCYNN